MSGELAARQRLMDRLAAGWPEFTTKRQEHLAQRERFGTAPEKATEEILRDLFTQVLDWPLRDLNYQLGRADLVLTSPGVRWVVVEAKRPDALAWNRKAVTAALDQACRYAAEQKVRCVAISDARMLYAADVAHGGIADRLYVDLAAPEPPGDLWWLSVHGIYHHRDGATATVPLLPEDDGAMPGAAVEPADGLLHKKYKLPARCFAYVGDAADPATWKLPFLMLSGAVDTKRLPGAIGAVLKSYRGERVRIPEPAVGDVLVRLAHAAREAGKLPLSVPGADGSVYGLLAVVLDQLGRFDSL